MLWPAARPIAAWLLACCVAITTVVGMLVAGQARADPLDHGADAAVRTAFRGHLRLLYLIADIPEPVQYGLLTVALIAACLLTRRVRGAVLAALSLLVAIVLTEFVLKPLVGRTLGGALVYPSGHTSRSFALAAVIAVVLLGPERPPLPFAARLALALTALLIATAVAVAVTGIRYHYFSDTIGGAAVGIGTVAAMALALDRALAAWAARRSG